MELRLIRVQARQKGITGYVNCLRGSWLGNPFPLTKYSREECLRLYKAYLDWRILNDTIFRNYLLELGAKSRTEDVTLGCTCKPKAKCHVDTLIETIKSITLMTDLHDLETSLQGR